VTGYADGVTGYADGVRTGELEAFRAVGSHLARRGLVAGSEGNLSIRSGDRLVITRSGCRLGALTRDDVLAGTLSDPPAGASSDLAVHRSCYRSVEGARAVVHAHPPGSVPDGWVEGEPHGVAAAGTSLEHAVATLETSLSEAPSAGGGVPGRPAEVVRPFAAAAAAFRDGGDPRVLLVDQTRLPGSVETIECRGVEDVADAVRRLAVRGAPILGVTAALAMALAAIRARDGGEDVRDAVTKAGGLLVATRPTAVNIRWAVDRTLAATASVPAGDLPEAVLAEARAIEGEDAAACSAMGWLGAGLIPEGANVLTHCNTGMLCTAGIGTAFGVLWCAHLAGKGIHVWADETRPALQGARLTAWELARLGVPFTLIPDSAAGSLMVGGRVDAVVVGADRIASNGDVANKVGTYALAVLAERHGIPFLVVAPTSTIDLGTASGADIPIEERDPAEVTHLRGSALAPQGTRAYNPAFDVTPGALVTSIVTERGVVSPPYGGSLEGLVAAGTHGDRVMSGGDRRRVAAGVGTPGGEAGRP
jgi:methylthioribose-1-phosphate isomerase